MDRTPKSLRAKIKRPLADALQRSGLLTRWTKAELKDRAIILTYHRVLERHELPDNTPPGMYVTPQVLEEHLRYLTEEFQLVTLDEIGEWGRGARTFEKTPCAITFDDGWEDNYRYAFEILRGFRAPATIFLITEQIGTPGMMTWSDVRQMEEAGVSFGSHTATHPELPTLKEDRIRWELESSLQTLQERLKRPSSWFCYPKGLHSPAARRIAREYYSGAVSASGGPVARGDDRYVMKRIGLHYDVSYTIPLLACRLARIF